MNFLSTVEQSPLFSFFPKGWDLERIEACCMLPPEAISQRQSFWHPQFYTRCCEDAAAFDVMMGHSVAVLIRGAYEEDKPIALLLTAGLKGMYRWLAYFLLEWNVSCAHVHTFALGEWSDKDGNEPEQGAQISLQNELVESLFVPLGALTVPMGQRSYATQHSLPKYAQKLSDLKSHGASIVMVYAIGRMMNIGFWEPHLAAGFASEEEWKAQAFRKSVALHALTVEQHALERFFGRTAMVPCFANTVGPGVFLQCDYAIGGCSDAGGAHWQSTALWTTLRYGPSVWVPSSFMPTLPGQMYYTRNLIEG